VTAIFLLVLVLMAAMAAAANLLGLDPWLTFLLILLAGLPLGAWLLTRILRPLSVTLQGLSDGIRSFRDRDFSVRLADARQDELGELARLYNTVGEFLQQERYELRQKELLLGTALNRSPVAILLVNPGDRIIYSNHEARRLLLGGDKLEGRRFQEIRDGCPESMRDILASDSDGIFTVQGKELHETFHLAQRSFQLNRRRHTLLLLQRMTGELGRQEAETWKRVIRVISHELNNSLAPVSSLVHSAGLIAGQPEQRERLEEIFSTIRERLDHLKQFIDGYARFARLPKPHKQPVAWPDLLAGIGELAPAEIDGSLPSTSGYCDPAQIQQLLVNLVKNAVEASGDSPEVSIRVQVAAGGGAYLQVLDRGRGMDEETMRQALVPFYSTKQSGSGLGLPLCREIIEAHGGKISLQARAGGGTTVTCWLPPQ
jgi:signal transduction histidine kinase